MASAVTPSTPDHAAPGSIQSDRLRLARDAHDRAQSLVAVSNKAEAQRWMDRACRLLPSDDTLALAMASGCLGQDDARAAETFARLAARYGSREAWTGLAVSRRNLGDHMGAAEAVSRALSTLVPDETLADVASLVARRIAAPGWCWASVDGALDIHVTYDPGEIVLEIDGQRRQLWRGLLTAGKAASPGAWWNAARQVGVIADGRHLLGSPIDVRAIRRVEGCVTVRDGAARRLGLAS